MAYQKNRIAYDELSRAKIQETRNLVISAASKGGYTLAQQLCAQEGNKETQIFLSGAFIVSDLNGLYNLRDALNVAIIKVENANKNSKNYNDFDSFD